jgi:hypothetical protein
MLDIRFLNQQEYISNFLIDLEKQQVIGIVTYKE